MNLFLVFFREFVFYVNETAHAEKLINGTKGQSEYRLADRVVNAVHASRRSWRAKTDSLINLESQVKKENDSYYNDYI